MIVNLAQSHFHPLIDGAAVSCAFNSNNCSKLVRGRGGFQEHHPWPLSLAGPEKQAMLVLCGNHHVRQHSLIRYLIESAPPVAVPPGGGAAVYAPPPQAGRVLRHFTRAEQAAAQNAVALWVTAGAPTIAGWPCPAATP